MKIRELVAELQKFPQEKVVRRSDWVCGGETHQDWQEEAEVSSVAQSDEYPDSVVLK